MKNLGNKSSAKQDEKRVVLRLLSLFLFFSLQSLYAAVTAKVDMQEVELGEMVTYSLTISGEDITRPNIQKICGVDVISTSSQTSVRIRNAEVIKNYTLSYKFVPQKSCRIDPVEVEVDGAFQKSNAVDIKVVEQTTKKDPDFVLTLQSDKKNLYVGETFELTLLFKQRKSAEAVDSKFTPPELKGFWVKSEAQPQKYEQGSYIVTKLVYTLAPQRPGELDITRAQMQVASRGAKSDSWGAWIPSIKWKTYFSNRLTLNVKPLPSGVTLVGDFQINATVDKKEAQADEAIHFTIEVQGRGNLEDIQSFKPDMQNVAVYEEKAEINGTKLTQKIVFVADENFIIPSFSLRYFNPKTQEIHNVKTKPIEIKIISSKVKKDLIVKKETPEISVQKRSISAKFNLFVPLFSFFIGLLLGGVLIYFRPWRKLKMKKTVSIKDPKILLMKLLPFKNDEEVQTLIDILEKNIYQNENAAVNKKLLRRVVKKYKID